MVTACRVLLDLFNTTLPSKARLWVFNSLSSPVAEAALKLLVPTEWKKGNFGFFKFFFLEIQFNIGALISAVVARPQARFSSQKTLKGFLLKIQAADDSDYSPLCTHRDNHSMENPSQGVFLEKPRLSSGFYPSKPNHFCQEGPSFTFSRSCLSCFVLASREHIVC